MIRSRELGLFNAYAVTLTAILTVCFWVSFASLEFFGIRDLSRYFDAYAAYWLISISGLMLQLSGIDSRRVNMLSTDPLHTLQISISQILHIAAALTIMLVLTKDHSISRLFLVIYLVVLQIALLLANANLTTLLSKAFFSGKNQIPALLIGKLNGIGRVRRWLRRMESYGVNAVGLLTEQQTPRKKTILQVPIIGEASDLPAILAKVRIETVILLDVPSDKALLESIIEATDRAGARMIVHNNLSEVFKHSLRFYKQFGVDFIMLREEPLQDPMKRIAKRALDLLVSLPAVLFVLPPLAIFVAIIHRTQSPGPLFFRQTRAGIQNRRFEILKFRTMHATEFDPTRQATKGDERIFSFGRFLRKTSIDEIPQFINVLFGDMSVVGPRPHIIAHNDQFAEALRHYHVRTFVKPGVTGLAQVQGFRGEAKTPADIGKRVACDIDYIERWSLFLDIFIICQTAWQVVRPPKSAY